MDKYFMYLVLRALYSQIQRQKWLSELDSVLMKELDRYAKELKKQAMTTDLPED